MRMCVYIDSVRMCVYIDSVRMCVYIDRRCEDVGSGDTLYNSGATWMCLLSAEKSIWRMKPGMSLQYPMRLSDGPRVRS